MVGPEKAVRLAGSVVVGTARSTQVRPAIRLSWAGPSVNDQAPSAAGTIPRFSRVETPESQRRSSCAVPPFEVPATGSEPPALTLYVTNVGLPCGFATCVRVGAARAGAASAPSAASAARAL